MDTITIGRASRQIGIRIGANIGADTRKRLVRACCVGLSFYVETAFVVRVVGPTQRQRSRACGAIRSEQSKHNNNDP